MERKEELLRLCLEFMKRQSDSGYVLNIFEQEFDYDGTTCDGYCLMEDIELELGM